jgi:hypothetical protein
MISPFANLNRIDSVIKEAFGSENVTFDQQEKRMKDGSTHNYIFNIKSGNTEIKMVIEGEQAFNSSNFKWSYYSDPTNKESTLITRHSNLTSLNGNLKEIFEKKMFSKEYLTEMVNEGINNWHEKKSEEKVKDIFRTSDEEHVSGEKFIEVYEENLENAINKFGLDVDSIHIEGERVDIQLYSSTHDGEISTRTRIDMETFFNKFPQVDTSWFSNSVFKIDFHGVPELYSGKSSKQI